MAMLEGGSIVSTAKTGRIIDALVSGQLTAEEAKEKLGVPKVAKRKGPSEKTTQIRSAARIFKTARGLLQDAEEEGPEGRPRRGSRDSFDTSSDEEDMVTLESEIERFEAAVGKSEHMPGYVHTFHDKEIGHGFDQVHSPCAACSSTLASAPCCLRLVVCSCGCGCAVASALPLPLPLLLLLLLLSASVLLCCADAFQTDAGVRRGQHAQMGMDMSVKKMLMLKDAGLLPRDQEAEDEKEEERLRRANRERRKRQNLISRARTRLTWKHT